jgi:DNA-binding beta-propeller fold protein YncE
VATPDGRFLYVAKYFIGGISGYAIADNGALSPLPAMPEAAQLCTRIAAMSPDGGHLYVGAVCGLPDIINAVRGFAIADDGMLSELPGSPFLVSALTVQLADDVAITPDGSKVLVSSTNYPTFGAPVSVMARAEDGTLSLVPDSPVITGFTPSGTLVCDDAHAFVVKNGCIGCDVEDPMGIVTLDIGSDGTLESTSALMSAGLSPNHAVLWTPPTKPTTPGDLDGDGDVDGFDLAQLLAAWGRCPKSSTCAADLNGSGAVDGFDLAILLGQWS